LVGRSWLSPPQEPHPPLSALRASPLLPLTPKLVPTPLIIILKKWHWQAGTHPVVDDLLEVHADSAAVDVGMSVAGMNQNADLLRPDLRRSISEHKQHRVDDVRLAAAVGSNDR